MAIIFPDDETSFAAARSPAFALSNKPCTTPARSSALRFWLILLFASIRVISMRTAHNGAKLRGNKVLGGITD